MRNIHRIAKVASEFQPDGTGVTNIRVHSSKRFLLKFHRW